jgi:hypothetical protein
MEIGNKQLFEVKAITVTVWEQEINEYPLQRKINLFCG